MSSPPAPPVEPPDPGDPPEVGAYQVLGRLGRGGMGTVHLGRAADGRLAAIKIVHEELARDDEFRARFAAEVVNAERVASFCTAQVLGQGEIDGRPYMVTEFIDGLTLHQHVSRNGPLEAGTLHGVAIGVAAGLAAIHSAGLVHRDLKPANVILSVSGPRVIDFGIARALDVASGATPSGVIVGSPGWIAPEQLTNKQIGTFADIFAWACLICYAGSGRHPYGRGDAVTMAARILHAEPQIGPLPRPLGDLVARALSVEPGDRPTALELLLALVGGGSQGVERATAQLIASEWRSPSPSPEAPPPGPPPEASPGTPPPEVAAPPGAATDPNAGEPATAALRPAPAPGPDAAPARAGDMTGRLTPAGVDTPVPAAAPRRRGRTIALLAAAVAVVLLAGGAFAYVKLRPGTPAEEFRAVPLGRTHPTDVGRQIHLGPVDMTIGQPRCGPSTFRGRTAKGRFCLLPLLVANDGSGGGPRTVRLSPARLQLLDTGGTQRTPAAVVDGLNPGDTELSDGARVAGNLLFDLPRGADPQCIWLFTTERQAAKRVKAWL